MKPGKSILKLLLLQAVFLQIFFMGKSQNIQYDRAEVVGNKIIVHYNIIDDNPNHQYLISLFSSKDNFTAPLTRVSGDVGTEVRPGVDKKIVWDVTQEFGLVKFSHTFEVRGRVFIPFVKLVEFNEGRVFKRGGNYTIVWTSGNLSGQVNIELFRGEETISRDNNMPNIGRYDWSISANTKPADNYRLKFTNTRDRNDFVYSLPFTIKPKVPFFLKALGAAVVGGGIAAAIILGGGGNNTHNTTVTPFSDDPGQPTN